jgi:hypothetical protein
MPLKKVLLRPGVNKENTRYTSESGWYDCDKIRFRQGTPEKIGGWQRISANTFVGICRSLWTWVTLGSQKLIGVGTNLKFYISSGGAYYDITPTTTVHTLTNPFATQSGSTTVTVTDATGGYINNNFVTFTGATAVGGITISGEYQLTYASSTTYTITAASAASSTASGGGTVYAVYQINVGPAYAVPLVGWGAGPWGSGTWGVGTTSNDAMRLWSQSSFGEDLIYGPRGGPIYYWDAGIGYQAPIITMTIATPCVVSSTIILPDLSAIIFETTGALPTGLLVGTIYYTRYVSSTTFNLSLTPTGALINTTGSQSGTHTISPRGMDITTFAAASNCPIIQNYILVSDTSRYVFAFGCNALGSTTQDPMQIRWSNQESVVEWTPAATNTAGDLRLSHGSKIVTAMQARQEILVWTDSSLYSLQYVGAPVVWGSQLVGDNVSIAGENAVGYANGVAYWMGVDKFYKYDGRTQTLSCDLRQFVFENIDKSQFDQVMCGTNEGFNEVWWFYVSNDSVDYKVDSYVVYNYLEPDGKGGIGVWYYGSMARTAWLDSGLRDYPLAATYNYNLVDHEIGVDDKATATTTPIEAYITSAEFDIEDGDRFGFIWRVVPDITFRGSTAASPQVTMYLKPMQNSGSGYNSPASVGGDASATITRTATLPIEEFTGQIYTRVRGRQIAMEVRSTATGVTWQLGSPRLDIRQDGRR